VLLFEFFSKEIISNSTFVPVSSISISANDMEGPQSPQQVNFTITPSDASIQTLVWEVDDENIAFIDQNGVLYPKNNGVVNVTATSADLSGNHTQTVSVNITKQTREIYVSGTSLEKSADQLFNYKDLNNNILSGIYYAYVPLTVNGDFNLKYKDENGQDVVYGIDLNGKLVQGGQAITVAKDAPYRIKLDFNTNSIEVMEISNWKLVGTQVPGSWSGGAGLELAYQGGSIWQSELTLTRDANETYDATIFRMNDRGDALLGSLWSDFSKLSYVSDKDLFGDVRNFPLPDGTYIVTLDLENYTYKFEAASIDENTIVFCGSSVADGYGAVNSEGYAYMYEQLLTERRSKNEGNSWIVKNVSIGGDNTIKVDNRYDLDVTSAGGKYLVFGLSMGNEGIMSGGQAIFDQFKNNMLDLIERAKNDGYYPIVVSNYANGLYDATDYEYVKQMNLLIHQWDVPSINVLGALDDGGGKFINGENGLDDYMEDTAHPNTKGHQEFFYSFVPSMFDAISNGKPIPGKVLNTFIEVDNNSGNNRYFKYTPEEIVHSYTVSIDMKSSDFNGDIITLNDENSNAKLSYNKTSSTLSYIDFAGNSNQVVINLNNSNWNKITISHYWAREESIIYINDQQLIVVNEQNLLKSFDVNSQINSGNISLRELYFYRSGMNIDEVSAMFNGDFLKSSLELYAPLDGQGITGSNETVNLAQSNSQLIDLGGSNLSTINNKKLELKVYPVPSSDYVIINQPFSNGILNIYSINGNSIYQSKFSQNENIKIDVRNFKKGLYLVKLSDRSNNIYSNKIIVK
jgi:lysophospholipase L1-like esterase